MLHDLYSHQKKCEKEFANIKEYGIGIWRCSATAYHRAKLPFNRPYPGERQISLLSTVSNSYGLLYTIRNREEVQTS